MDLKDRLAALGEDRAAEKAEKLLAYMEGLLEKNRYINLTAITDPEEFIEKHFMDSLTPCGQAFFENVQRVIDLGTGGGFPGIPLAVLRPEKEFVLADSLAKRLAVIDELCGKIGIDNVRTVHGRAEDLGRAPEFRETFDLCVSRAVADMSVLAEYCLPLVKRGGYFCAYKSWPVEEELQRARKAIKVLGGGKTETACVQDIGAEKAHCLVIVEKSNDTPARYPRRAGTPSTKPIR